jgi:hypothetical protein
MFRHVQWPVSMRKVGLCTCPTIPMMSFWLLKLIFARVSAISAWVPKEGRAASEIDTPGRRPNTPNNLETRIHSNLRKRVQTMLSTKTAQTTPTNSQTIPEALKHANQQWDFLQTPVNKSRQTSRAPSPELAIKDLESSPFESKSASGLFSRYQTPRIASRQSSPINSPMASICLSQQEPSGPTDMDESIFHQIALLGTKNNTGKPKPLLVVTHDGLPSMDLDLITPVDQIQPLSPFSRGLEEKATLATTNRHNTPPKSPASRLVESFPFAKPAPKKDEKKKNKKRVVKKTFSKSAGYPEARQARPTPRAFHSSTIISRKHATSQKEGKLLPDTPKKGFSVQNTPTAFNTSILLDNQSPSLLYKPSSAPGSSLFSPTPLRSKPATPDTSEMSSPFQLGKHQQESFDFEPDFNHDRHDSMETVDLVLHPRRSLRQSISNTALSHQDTFTPYPRFLTPAYFQRIRDSNGHWEADVSNDSTADYFEGQFVVHSVLGHGSFAEAYRVQDRSDDQSYAVKKSIHQYQGQRDRFKKLEEVEILWKLSDCPQVVHLKQAWEQRGHLYIQTELCEESLQQRIETMGHVDEATVWRLLGHISLGLFHIHGRGIVHLDLKPANILLIGNQVKIADFGLATYIPVSSDSEREGDRVYLAPEIINSSKYDTPADVFSLGLLMVEVAGSVVLPQNGDEWARLRRGDISTVNLSRYSHDLQQLLKRMVNKDPALRPSALAILRHPKVAKYISVTDLSSNTLSFGLTPLADLAMQWEDDSIQLSLEVDDL